MSRIIAGQAAGTRLVPVKGDQTRPTTDRVKEALFSRLESWDVIENKSVIDLFAGSGALGLEAASRGSHRVQFVEKSQVAFRALTANIEVVRSRVDCDLHSTRQGAETFLEHLEEQKFDLVLMDPPYDFPDTTLNDLLIRIAPMMNPDGVVVVERDKRSSEPQWPEPLTGLKPRKYGETILYFAEFPEE